MKILVTGASGFAGRSVVKILSPDHEVVTASRDPHHPGEHEVDLRDVGSIQELLETIKPDAIVNCAGIVDATQDVSLNEVFTRNILEAVAEGKFTLRRIVVLGSASEYGKVEPDELPVKEDSPLRADAGYGLSKKQEVATALRLAEEHNLPVVVARIFNPVGGGMHPRMLIPALLRQVNEIKAGERKAIEVGRLDGTRDFLAMSDAALAVKALVEHVDLPHNVYNVGSGERTTIRHLVELIVEASALSPAPELKQTMPDPEPLFAVQADISRIKADTGWQPQMSLEDAIKELVDEQ